MTGRLPILAVLAITAFAASSAPDRVISLSGVVTPRDKGTYQEHTFDVAADTRRLTFDFEHDRRGSGTELEVGIFDPVRFRGTSRFSKTRFHIAERHATPSYFPGPLPAGTWRLTLGVPSVARDSRWRLTVRASSAASQDPLSTARRAGPAWYAGDLHAHTLHSDAFGCTDRPGAPTRGCHVWEVVDAARDAGLDFLAITDHNTTSHHAELAVLQETLDGLLLLRGQEVTTFRGHANVYGTSSVVDFRLGFKGRTILDLLRDVQRDDALLSVNHPARETGDRCTGCGWDAPGTEWSRIPALEVVNGTVVEGPTAGLPFWYARLNEGHRITAIGGSDDHAARSDRGRIGRPTTVVFAADLSERSLLAGIRGGRVFIRPRGAAGPSIDLELTEADRRAVMGESLNVSVRAAARLRVTIADAEGQHLHVVASGRPIHATRVGLDGEVTLPVPVAPGDWVHALLRDERGITAISNPIYIR